MSAKPAGPGGRTSLRRDPLRLLCSAAPWSSAWFLAGYLLVSWLLFSAALTAAVTAAVLAITLVGIPLLIAADGVIRGCANVERARLRHMLPGPVRARYREVAAPGMLAQVRVRWRDPAIWRDLAYLIGLWLPLYVLDTIVFAIWLTFLAGITLPVWYWAPRGNAGIGYANGTQVHGVVLGYFPHGPSRPGGVGLYVDTLPKALLAAAVFLALFLLFNYVLVAIAQAHARVGRALLRPSADPLAGAREVLAGPRPLGPLKTESRNGAAPASHPS
jgi:hypothetical protein